jgi:hypothetical protein
MPYFVRRLACPIIRDEGVAGSNHATPTNILLKHQCLLEPTAVRFGPPGQLSGQTGYLLIITAAGTPAAPGTPGSGAVGRDAGAVLDSLQAGRDEVVEFILGHGGQLLWGSTQPSASRASVAPLDGGYLKRGKRGGFRQVANRV